MFLLERKGSFMLREAKFSFWFLRFWSFSPASIDKFWALREELYLKFGSLENFLIPDLNFIGLFANFPELISFWRKSSILLLLLRFICGSCPL